MSRIRSCDTAPERAVRSALHRLGFRFRKASGAKILGKPDVVLVKHHVVIFVHGCFWHRHTACKWAYTPKTRQDFWSAKFAANRKRDMLVAKKLRKAGWKTLVIWECQLRTPELTTRLLASKLTGLLKTD